MSSSVLLWPGLVPLVSTNTTKIDACPGKAPRCKNLRTRESIGKIVFAVNTQFCTNLTYMI